MTETSTSYKADTNATNNGNKPSNKPKKQRRTCGIPMVKALSEMPLANYEGRVEQQPTSWDDIKNYQFFSPNQDGSRLMQKITRAKSLDIQTKETLPTTYGQGYLVHLEANPNANEQHNF